MFVIKSPRKSQFLLRSEDDLSISFNLVRTHGGASGFDTSDEAIKVRDEAVENAKSTIQALQKIGTQASMTEAQDINEQYLSLIVTEIK